MWVSLHFGVKDEDGSPCHVWRVAFPESQATRTLSSVACSSHRLFGFVVAQDRGWRTTPLGPNRRTDRERPEHSAGTAFHVGESGARRIERRASPPRIDAGHNPKHSLPPN